MTTFRVGASGYTVSGTVGELPLTYTDVVEHATLHDDFGIGGADGTCLVVYAGSGPMKWPELVVSQRFDPGPEAGFFPGALVVPENQLVFLGAGTRLLAYDLRRVERLWEDHADTGFWGWYRYGNAVLMSAELEFAAWDAQGRKMWSMFVEPPWHYAVRNGRIDLDVMGKTSAFDVEHGPPAERGE